MSLEETPQDAISKEEHQHMEAKKWLIENEMTNLQLGLSKQFDALSSLEEQEKLHKEYEAEVNPYSRWLYYYNILLSAGTVETQTQDKACPDRFLCYRVLNQLRYHVTLN